MRRLPASLLIVLAAVAGCAQSGETPSSTAPTLRVLPSVTLSAPETQAATPVHPRTPVRLRVWHYDAPVVPLSLDGGALVPPSDPTVLGWWGKPAGARHGTTLLTGHTVHTGGGTFDDLESIPLGEVASLSGVRYAVERVEVISKAALAERAPRLFAQTGEPRLVLVTCEGYDAATGEYDDNVVVTLIPSN